MPQVTVEKIRLQEPLYELWTTSVRNYLVKLVTFFALFPITSYHFRRIKMNIKSSSHQIKWRFI